LVRPRRLVTDCKEDDVQDDHDCDVKALVNRGDVAQQEGKLPVMIDPDDARVEPRLESFQRVSHKWEVSQPCQFNRQSKGSQANRSLVGWIVGNKGADVVVLWSTALDKTGSVWRKEENVNHLPVIRFYSGLAEEIHQSHPCGFPVVEGCEHSHV
jgi:hypothetical protein